MDREILFRGKRVDNGEWVEGYYVKIEETPYIFTGEIFLNSHLNDYGVPCAGLTKYIVIPETVGQYTGLDTDEKTTHVYKDDIVAFNNGDVCFKGRVDKECGAWGIVADNIPLECQSDNFISFFEIMWNLGNSDMILDDVVPHVEVIGNIHANPELLEVAE